MPTVVAVTPAQNDDRVFIVYGHDTSTRDALELMLLRMNLKPVILSNMAPEGKTIIEALTTNTNVKYAVVLLTPDDQGHKVGHPNEI
jgi:predicted nucleotide-binding protein